MLAITDAYFGASERDRTTEYPVDRKNNISTLCYKNLEISNIWLTDKMFGRNKL